MNKFQIMAICLFATASVLALIALFFGASRSKKVAGKDRVSTSLSQKLYIFLSSFILTRQLVVQIRTRLEIISVLNEREIRRKVVQMLMILSVVFAVVLVFVLLITGSVLMLVLAVFMLFLSFEILIDVYVSKINIHLLDSQLRLNERIRHEYFNTGMIDDAIYEASNSLAAKDYEMFVQGQKIYDVLVAKDVEKEIIRYNETAPNKFLKMLLGLCYMTMEYGDISDDGTSVFMKNLSDLTAEIRLELSKRERINRGIFTLNFISLSPLFFIEPIRAWASKYFLPLKVFYASGTGTALKYLTILAVLLSFIAIRRLARFNKTLYEGGDKRSLNYIYKHFLKRIVDYMGSLKENTSYDSLKSKLIKTFSNHSPETFITKKVLMFFIGFILTLSLVLSVSINEKARIRTEPTLPEYFLGGSISDKQLKAGLELSKKDNEIIDKLGTKASYEDIYDFVKALGLTDEQSEITSRRIAKKNEVLRSDYIPLRYLLLVFLVAICFYFLPDISIAFRRKILEVEVDDEIAGFDSIILMLMHHKRMTVIDILEWLELYATTFKGAISDCINDFSSGSDEALVGLSRISDNERFARIVNGLLSASEDISIKEAFYELVQDKQYFIEKRKILNEEIIDKKINAAKFFGFLPIYAFLLLYMILPMIICAVNDMNKYFSKINF